MKENWICAMTRHHAEPNIRSKVKQEMFLLTLTSDIEASFNDTITLFVEQ